MDIIILIYFLKFVLFLASNVHTLPLSVDRYHTHMIMCVWTVSSWIKDTLEGIDWSSGMKQKDIV